MLHQPIGVGESCPRCLRPGANYDEGITLSEEIGKLVANLIGRAGWTPQSNLKHPFAERSAIGERRAQLSGIACSPRPRERDPDERRDRLAIVACSNL